MKTFASLFTGFGGADLGAIAAGLQPVWGVEYDAKIAEVANHNLGQHIQVADILSCDPLHFERPDVLHASPPCPSFSVAKANGQETPHDIAMASKVAEFVSVLTPEIFTLENVYAYRNSKSWRIIENALYKAGYWLHIDHVNSADYGVPQTRKRMIVRAVRGGFVPYLPLSVALRRTLCSSLLRRCCFKHNAVSKHVH
jgi:DNA (cytosine-5)-methyltransferase 1